MLKTTNAVKIAESDNVAVLIADIPAGIEIFGAISYEAVPQGHKIALEDIKKGCNVIKYGYPIGHALTDIKKGSHVHTHNLQTNLKGLLEYKYQPELASEKSLSHRTFFGYKRDNGKIGIRNEIWIINTVGCVNKVAERAAAEASKKFEGETDGIFTFVHPFGCSQLGDDHVYTQKILAGMVNHPNAAAVLVLGLGCENNNIEEFKKVLGEYDERRVRFLELQEADDDIADIISLIGELMPYVKKFKREEISASSLTIGLKCGGSDGFSGITANPLVGRVSDKITECGGTAILSEVPEMFGAETILMNRCKTEELFNKTTALINDFKAYYIRYNQEVYENPSLGNKKGGISTLEDKSLGCTQKGGTSNVTAVLDYGETVSAAGLNLLKGPGNDIVSITNLTAAGAHMILFTTGRGTPVGAPVPTIKISTNSELARKKHSWIDFDAGILLGDVSMDDLSERFMDYVLDVASGKVMAKNEINNYREIAIFKDGVTL